MYSVLMSPGVLTSVLRNVELLPVSVSVECLSSGPVKHCVKSFLNCKAGANLVQDDEAERGRRKGGGARRIGCTCVPDLIKKQEVVWSRDWLWTQKVWTNHWRL